MAKLHLPVGAGLGNAPTNRAETPLRLSSAVLIKAGLVLKGLVLGLGLGLGLALMLDAKAQQSSLPACPPLTADRQRPIDPAGIAALERCLQQLPQTRSLHWQASGYDPDRLNLHQRILQQFQAQARCVRPESQPVAVLTGGPPGAGKTTWLMTHLPGLMQPGWLRIDADALRAQLPEYHGWNAAQTQDETSDLVSNLLSGVDTDCRVNLFYDGTLSSPDRYLKLIPKLKRQNYDVYIVRVLVPETISRQRVLERYRRSGRYVPEAVITGYFKNAATTFAQLRPLVDGYLQVNGLTNQIVNQGGSPLPRLMINMQPASNSTVSQTTPLKTDRPEFIESHH